MFNTITSLLSGLFGVVKGFLDHLNMSKLIKAGEDKQKVKELEEDAKNRKNIRKITGKRRKRANARKLLKHPDDR